MVRKMTDAEWRDFVSTGTRTGKLATVREDGRPHVTPIWFLLEGDALIFMMGASTVKGRSLRRDPRVAICVDDDTPPYSFVLVEGRAALTDDLDEMRAWARRIGGRYMGEERAEEFGERNAVPGELLVRVSIDAVVAEHGVAE